MTFRIPTLIPVVFGLSFFSLMVAFRMKATVSIFDLIGEKRPLIAQVSELYENLCSVKPLNLILGTKDVESLIISAGTPGGITVEEFNLLRVAALGVALASVCLGIMLDNIFWFLLAVVVKVPEWWLSSLAVNRSKAMKREFFIVASRLSAAYAAGLDTYASLEWASSPSVSSKKSALREELQRALEKEKMDAPIEDVLDEFANRTGLLEARRLATVITNAQKYGSSAANKLTEAVKDTRERRKAFIIGQAKVAEQKMQLAVIVMALPTIICTLVPMLMALSLEGGGMF